MQLVGMKQPAHCTCRTSGTVRFLPAGVAVTRVCRDTRVTRRDTSHPDGRAPPLACAATPALPGCHGGAPFLRPHRAAPNPHWRARWLPVLLQLPLPVWSPTAAGYDVDALPNDLRVTPRITLSAHQVDSTQIAYYPKIVTPPPK